MLLQNKDFEALARDLESRFGEAPAVESLNAVRDLIAGRLASSVGGAVDDPWSDATWLIWVKNRLEEIAANSEPGVALLRLQDRLAEFDKPPGTQEEWRRFLHRYSEELLATDDLDIPDVARRSDWMGFEPASEAAIVRAEQGLGQRLPPSLRMFYSVSNGWRTTGFFVYNILPVEEIGWLRDREPGLYSIASDAESTVGPWKNDPGDARLKEYRDEQGTRVKRCLVISSQGDSATWLLDPGPDAHEGEWPGGCWASWNPAMSWTATSFADLMAEELRTLIRLREG